MCCYLIDKDIRSGGIEKDLLIVPDTSDIADAFSVKVIIFSTPSNQKTTNIRENVRSDCLRRKRLVAQLHGLEEEVRIVIPLVPPGPLQPRTRELRDKTTCAYRKLRAITVSSSIPFGSSYRAGHTLSSVLDRGRKVPQIDFIPASTVAPSGLAVCDALCESRGQRYPLRLEIVLYRMHQ
jgi:hypothetical protein